jgi:hypothetical protein
MRYLVSGASSYLCSSFIGSKNEKEFLEVVNNYKFKNEEYKKSSLVPRISAEDLSKSDQEFDCIIHFAASLSTDDTSWFDLGKTLIDFSIKNSTPIILLGTFWQFHDDYRNQTYTKLKMLEQEYLRSKNDTVSNYAICFLGDLYGPSDSRDKIINHIISSLKINKSFKLKNSMGVMNPIYVEDMTYRLELISQLLKSKTIFQENVSLFNQDWYYSHEVLKIIEDCFSPDTEFKKVSENTRTITHDFGESFFKLKKLNYPETSLNEGINKILNI